MTDRTPLILLPGLLCDARLWRDPAAALGDIAVPVVADLSRGDSVDALAARVLATADAAGFGRFALAGLSMGGYVALAVLRQAAERVERLALFDTSARPDSDTQARRRRGLLALARRTPPGGRFRGVTPRLLPQLLHPDNLSGPLGAEVIAMAERLGRDAFLDQQAAILGRPDSRPMLSGIAVPTLVAVGEADGMTPPALSAEMAAGIPGAELRTLPGCGHLPPMESPGPVGALLRDWLLRPA
ncbi:alpha/beta fold hydrolase [Roseomonas sp. BN140053]|uniref:alpha/beta fold hydrolase n=1 Tax=Roseomonas sp. BN140053 TaxID=3391898 RepID=UPI0039EC60A2